MCGCEHQGGNWNERVLFAVLQGWFPHDLDAWGPNVLEQSLAAGDPVCPFLPRATPQTTTACSSIPSPLVSCGTDRTREMGLV